MELTIFVYFGDAAVGTHTSVECEKKRLTMCHCSLSHYTLACQFRMMPEELEKYVTILARRSAEYEERSEGLSTVIRLH